MTKANAKSKTIIDSIKEIQKVFGQDAVMHLNNKANLDIKVFSSGLLNLDMALGINGYPQGRIIEIYGPESFGKTSLALQAIAEAQKTGMKCVFIDVEHSIDVSYATKIGVKINELIFSQPNSAEQALQIVESLVKTKKINLIVLDSVAALTPQVEIDGEIGEQTIGVQARLMSKALRKLSSLLSFYNVSIIFINQIRMKIGVIFGNPEITPGGRALKFYSTIRLEVRNSSRIQHQSQIIGNEIRIKVVKNKLAAPHKMIFVDLIYGYGFDRLGTIINLAIERNYLQKAGSWYSYENKKLGQGKAIVKDFFQKNPKVLEKIINKIKEKN